MGGWALLFCEPLKKLARPTTPFFIPWNNPQQDQWVSLECEKIKEKVVSWNVIQLQLDPKGQKKTVRVSCVMSFVILLHFRSLTYWRRNLYRGIDIYNTYLYTCDVCVYANAVVCFLGVPNISCLGSPLCVRFLSDEINHISIERVLWEVSFFTRAILCMKNFVWCGGLQISGRYLALNSAVQP